MGSLLVLTLDAMKSATFFSCPAVVRTAKIAADIFFSFSFI